ncbi:hypothetical protein BSG18_32070 [Pseudomonas ogarae]|nr:hypothetical protein BSG18_32070 [Pseudomonas ogarae]
MTQPKTLATSKNVDFRSFRKANKREVKNYDQETQS